jgi:ribosomal protein L32
MDRVLYYSEVKAKHEKNIIQKRMLTPVSKCEYCGKMVNLNGICLICGI